MRRCDYCGQPSDEPQCSSCGSRDFDNKPVDQIIKGEPFHYNGYVVWWLADWAYETVEYLSYLGDRLVEWFTVSREVLRAFVPEHQAELPFIWDLFLLAQGEEEVLRVVEQNKIRPATFEISLIPTPEKKYASGLSYQSIGAAIAEGKREFTLREERLALEHAIEFFK